MIEATIPIQTTSVVNADISNFQELIDNNACQIRILKYKSELPSIGVLKILYIIEETTELYIWTGLDYIKVNAAITQSVDDVLSEYAQALQNDINELSQQIVAGNDELAQAIAETNASVETIASTQQELSAEIGSTLTQIEGLEQWKESAMVELSQLDDAIQLAQDSLSQTQDQMDNLMEDGVFTAAELATIKELYHTLKSAYTVLAREYNDINNAIRDRFTDTESGELNWDEIKEELPNYTYVQQMWIRDGGLDIDSTNIATILPDLSEGKLPYSDLTIPELYNIILALCKTMPEDKKIDKAERNVWDGANEQLTLKLEWFESYLKELSAQITLFDASDELLELQSSIVSQINGLQNQIDGKVDNWNAEGVPSPSNSESFGTAATPYDYNYPADQWWYYDEEGKLIDNRQAHINDTYVDLKTGKAYRWCKYYNTIIGADEFHWHEIEDTATAKALAEVALLAVSLDGKTTTFLQQEPTPPYNLGDCWIVHSDKDSKGNPYQRTFTTDGQSETVVYKKGEILNCITKKEEGNFDINDWSRECIYTDDTQAQLALDIVNAADDDGVVSKIERPALKEQLSQILQEWETIYDQAVSKKISDTICNHFKAVSDAAILTLKYYTGEEITYNGRTYKAEEDSVGSITIINDFSSPVNYNNIAEYYKQKAIISTHIENNIVSEANEAIAGLKLNLANISAAYTEIAEDVKEVQNVADLAFEDSKITPIEKQQFLSELREICGYLFSVANKTLESVIINHPDAFNSVNSVNAYLADIKSLSVQLEQEGSYGNLIQVMANTTDAPNDFTKLAQNTHIKNLHTALCNLFDIYNQLQIGNTSYTTDITEQSTIQKKNMVDAFTTYYNQEQAIIKSIQDKVAMQAAQGAKDYSDTQLSDTNTKLNSLFSDGMLTPSEKNNILYKIYQMFGQPETTWSDNCLLLKEGSGTDAGLSIVAQHNNTQTMYTFISWIGNCSADCDFVNTCNKVIGYFPYSNDSSGIWGNSMSVDLKVRALRNSIEELRKLFILENGNCRINQIMGRMELFSKAATILANPTEFLEWCEVFEKQLNLVKFNFLEYRLSNLDTQA